MLTLLGPTSSLLVMREALWGTRRFDQFVERLPLTEATVAARLRHLVDVGLLTKSRYVEAGQRPREEYVLTPMGQDLMPVIIGLMQWGDQHLGSDCAPMQVIDKATGQQVRLGYVNESGEQVPPESVLLTRAPVPAI